MRSIDIGGHTYDYDDFCKNLMLINKGKMVTTQGAYTSFMRILIFLFFLS